jgi:hypothetical protein
MLTVLDDLKNILDTESAHKSLNNLLFLLVPLIQGKGRGIDQGTAQGLGKTCLTSEFCVAHHRG